MSILWINGTYQDDTLPVFTAADRVRYGDGVFDTLLVNDGLAVHAARHFDRLERHAAVMGIDIPESFLDAFEKTLAQLLEKNELLVGKAAVNTIITRGESPRGLAFTKGASPTILMRVSPVPTKNDAPLNVIIARSVRRNEGSPLSRIKSLNYGDNVLAREEAARAGAEDAILLNNAGHVTCASAGNVFILKGGKLLTPPLTDGVLDGITRADLIKWHRAIEQSLTEEDLVGCEGMLITNSIRGSVPVHSLNGIFLPQPIII